VLPLSFPGCLLRQLRTNTFQDVSPLLGLCCRTSGIDNVGKKKAEFRFKAIFGPHEQQQLRESMFLGRF
jgi:hypothetical protein